MSFFFFSIQKTSHSWLPGSKGLTPVCGNRSGERQGSGGTEELLCWKGCLRREQAGPVRDPSCLVTTGTGKQAVGDWGSPKKLKIYRRKQERSRKQWRASAMSGPSLRTSLLRFSTAIVLISSGQSCLGWWESKAGLRFQAAGTVNGIAQLTTQWIGLWGLWQLPLVPSASSLGWMDCDSRAI